MTTSLPKVNHVTNGNALVNHENHADTSSASFVLTLPDTPKDGAIVRILDSNRSWGINSLTIVPSAKDTINGSSSLFINNAGSIYDFWYIAAKNKWVYFYQSKLDPNIVAQVISSNNMIVAEINNNRLMLDLQNIFEPLIMDPNVYDILVYNDKHKKWTNISISSMASELFTSSNGSIGFDKTKDGKLDLYVRTDSLQEVKSNVLNISGGKNSVLNDVSIQVLQAGAKSSGYLSEDDWRMFNEKQDASDKFIYGDGELGEIAIFSANHGIEGYKAGTAFNSDYGDSEKDLKMNGKPSAGGINKLARIDHIHPPDNTKQDLVIGAPKDSIAIFNDAGQVVDSGYFYSNDMHSNSDSVIISSKAVHSIVQDRVTGLFSLKGVWDADANSPFLKKGTGNVGDVYKVSVAGTQKSPSGEEVTYSKGDMVFYSDDEIWSRIDNVADVTSVHGRTGIVEAAMGDYHIKQITNGLSNELKSGFMFIGDKNGIARSKEISGDVKISEEGKVVVIDDSITNEKLHQANAFTWKGNATNGTSMVKDNAAGSLVEYDSDVLEIKGNKTLLSETQIRVKRSSAGESGYLHAKDYERFDNKQDKMETNIKDVVVKDNTIVFTEQADNKVMIAPYNGNGVPEFRPIERDDVFGALFSGKFAKGMMSIYDGTKFVANSFMQWVGSKLVVDGGVKANVFAVNEKYGAQGKVNLGLYGRIVIHTQAFTKSSRIYVSNQYAIGSPGMLYISERVEGDYFVIQSTSMTDRSEVSYLIVDSE